MSEILLVRNPALSFTPAELDAARRVTFGLVDGLGDVNKRRWRQFWAWLVRMEPGEIAEVFTRRPRSGPFHRMHMKLEALVFAAQERIRKFEQFRLWLKIGAGLVDWMAGPKGGVVPVPRSISYREMEEQEMREFHDASLEFLRTDHAIRYLWPHLPDAQRQATMDNLLIGYEEYAG